MLNELHSILEKAAAAQRAVQSLGGGRPAVAPGVDAQYDQLVTDQQLRDTTRDLFMDGYYALAVEEAFKCVNNTVKARSGLASADGVSLMNQAFSANAPALRLNSLVSESERNQQVGYMQIFAGCMMGIRNPRAHEHRYLDEPHIALEMLTWANHLIRMVNKATKTRARKQKAKPQGSTP